jgi:hypothetical protein
MQAEKFAGYFILATAVLVAVPVVLQMRARESDWKHAWSPILFFVGLAATGAAFAFMTEPKQTSIALGGVVAMLVGLIFSQKTTRAPRER